MNRTAIFPLLALCLAAAAPQAGASDTERDGAPIARSSLPRSEVIADLEVWQRSGLAALEHGEATDAFGPRYRVALARYLALRDSPAFAERAARLARERGETRLVADR